MCIRDRDYRTKKANNENCDYFISIHLNSATNTSAKGCEVWIYNENSKLQTLANNLCNNLATKMNTPNRGIKYSKKLAVLKNTKMPALLIEIDFISNKEVENYLRNDKNLKNISDTISSTLLSFVNKSIIDDGDVYKRQGYFYIIKSLLTSFYIIFFHFSIQSSNSNV